MIKTGVQPEEARTAEKTRVIVVQIDPERCKGCGLCAWACPKEHFEPSRALNQMGLRPYRVRKDETVCNGCMSCTLVCPDCAIKILES